MRYCFNGAEMTDMYAGRRSAEEQERFTNPFFICSLEKRWRRESRGNDWRYVEGVFTVDSVDEEITVEGEDRFRSRQLGKCHE